MHKYHGDGWRHVQVHKGCDVLKRYYLNPNKMLFESANITIVRTHTNEIRSNNEDNLGYRNMYDESENNKFMEVNGSEKKIQANRK